MKLEEYYQLIKNNEEKIPVIDAITECHPAIGTMLKWSWYEGGMADTGGWHVDVLLTVPLKTLQKQLDAWTQDDERAKEYAKKWAAMTLEEKKEAEQRSLQEFQAEFERAMMWGK